MAKKVFVVGLGNMGMSHALAYTRIPGYEVVGVCTRHIDRVKLPPALANARRYSSYEQGLKDSVKDPSFHSSLGGGGYNLLATIFLEKGRLAEAEKALVRSLENWPEPATNSPVVIQQEAAVVRRQGNLEAPFDPVEVGPGEPRSDLPLDR